MPQSVDKKDILSYKKEFEDRLICLTDEYNVHSRFLLGEEPNEYEYIYTAKMYSKLCPLNCDMVDYIRDVIKGKTPYTPKEGDVIWTLVYDKIEETECETEILW